AQANHLPVLDLFALGDLTTGPLTLGGTTLQPGQLFTPDLFHPGTVLQGLLANMFLEAEQQGYDTNVTGLRLSDQEILGLAGLDHNNKTTFFNVSGFVHNHRTPEPSTLVLAGTALLWGCGAWGRRRLQRRAA